MKRGLIFKTLLIILFATMIIGVAGCTKTGDLPTPTPDPTPGGGGEITTPDNKIDLQAPTLSVDENCVLKITPSSDYQTQKETKQYLVKINGETQIVNKDQLELSIPLVAGTDLVEVTPVGGKNTICDTKATLEIEESFKENIAFNKSYNILKTGIANLINSYYRFNDVEVKNIISINQVENETRVWIDFISDVGTRYSIDEIKLTNLNLNNNANIFEFYNTVKDFSNVVINRKSNFSLVQPNLVKNLIDNNYFSAFENIELNEYLENGWDISFISHVTGNTPLNLDSTFGDTYTNHTKINATFKATKFNESDRYLNASYTVRTKDGVLSPVKKIAEGTLPLNDMAITDEVITEQSPIFGIFDSAKEKYLK